MKNTEYRIRTERQTYRRIKALMAHVKTINEDREIGGWLTGQWSYDKENNIATCRLDRFIIPEQTVDRGEVDMSPESQIAMIRDEGPETCNAVKAHWHIHPFGKGATEWSSIDEEKIKSYMSPDKGRKAFVFLLSSYDTIKARVVINLETVNPITGSRDAIVLSLDNLPVEDEQDIADEAETVKKLEEEIKAKVKAREFKETKYLKPMTYFDYTWDNKKQKAVDEDIWEDIRNEKEATNAEVKKLTDEHGMYPGWPYMIMHRKNRIIVKMKTEFKIWLDEVGGWPPDVNTYNKMYENKDVWVLIYVLKQGDEREVEKCESILDEQLAESCWMMGTDTEKSLEYHTYTIDDIDKCDIEMD